MKCPGTIFLLAAGLGSRFGGPKQLQPVTSSKTVLFDYNLFQALQIGFRRIVCITRQEILGPMNDCLDPWRSAAQVILLTQPTEKFTNGQEKPLGTAHALYCARQWLLDEPFLVLNSDDYYGPEAWSDLNSFFEEETSRNAIVTYPLDKTIPTSGTVSRGICTIKNGRLTEIRETHNIHRLDRTITNGQEDFAPETPVSMNFFYLQPTFLGFLQEEWEKFVQNAPYSHEFLLPTVINSFLAADRGIVHPIATKAAWLGMTHRQDLPTLQEYFEEESRKKHYPTDRKDFPKTALHGPNN